MIKISICSLPISDEVQKSIEIDEIDAKILVTLLKNARTSFTKIAKECGISVGAVRMRYKRLWKIGVIKGEITLVNPHTLGYRHICDLGIIIRIEHEQDVLKFLMDKPYISHIAGPLGKYDIWAKVALREDQNLAEILDDIEENPHIKSVDALVWAEAVNVEYPENLAIYHSRSEKPKMNYFNNYGRINAVTTKVKIDETDRKIAIILSQNSRMSFSKIAKQLDISTKNVIRRYKKLCKNVLTLPTIAVDLNKLGYNAMASGFIKAENRSKIPEIQTQLLRIPNLIVIIRLIGAYDLYVAIVLRDFSELFKAQGQIRRIVGIDKVDIYLTPNVPAWPLNLFPSLLQSGSLPKIAFDS